MKRFVPLSEAYGANHSPQGRPPNLSPLGSSTEFDANDRLAADTRILKLPLGIHQSVTVRDLYDSFKTVVGFVFYDIQKSQRQG
jgi:hypothetical protein